jgi:hypothetical protein
MSLYKFDLSVTTQAQVRAAAAYYAAAGLKRNERLWAYRGIHLWINQINGKFYVGSTLHFHSRILSYLYLTKVYGILLKGIKKYGLNSLILVLIAIPDATKDSVLELEQYVLDTFQPEYNIQLCANSSAGRIMSEESKAKLAAFRTGLKHSEETKAPISASLIGEKNGRFNKGTPVYLYEVLPSEFELCASFPNRARASAILGIPASTPF